MTAIVTDPPWPGFGVFGKKPRKSNWVQGQMITINSSESRWDRALGRAMALLDREVAADYARRVGVETPRSAIEALEDSYRLAAIGLEDHVKASVVCTSCRLTMAAAFNLEPIYTVGGDVVRALAWSENSNELRTPPGAWTSAPPKQLFER